MVFTSCLYKDKCCTGIDFPQTNESCTSLIFLMQFCFLQCKKNAVTGTFLCLNGTENILTFGNAMQICVDLLSDFMIITGLLISAVLKAFLI